MSDNKKTVADAISHIRQAIDCCRDAAYTAAKTKGTIPDTEVGRLLLKCMDLLKPALEAESLSQNKEVVELKSTIMFIDNSNEKVILN